jgi:hypothetical protein
MAAMQVQEITTRFQTPIAKAKAEAAIATFSQKSSALQVEFNNRGTYTEGPPRWTPASGSSGTPVERDGMRSLRCSESGQGAIKGWGGGSPSRWPTTGGAQPSAAVMVCRF